MAQQTLKTIIKHKTDTSTNWIAINPILAKGEIGYDITEKKIKIGDGQTVWNSLSYMELLPEGGEQGAYLVKGNAGDFDARWQNPDDEPAEGSDNLIKSGAVFSAIGNIADALDEIMGV